MSPQTNSSTFLTLLVLSGLVSLGGCTLQVGDEAGRESTVSSHSSPAAVETEVAEEPNLTDAAPEFEVPAGVVFRTGFNQVTSFREPGQGIASSELGLLTGEDSVQIGIVAPSVRNLDVVTAQFFWGNMSSAAFNSNILDGNELSIYFVVGADRYRVDVSPDCSRRGAPLQAGASRICSVSAPLPDGNAPLVREGYWEVLTPTNPDFRNGVAFPAWDHQAPVAAGVLPAGAVVPWDWDSMSPQG